jgi:hypothetical protein
VRAVVVHHQVNVQAGGEAGVDVAEKAQALSKQRTFGTPEPAV